MTKKKAVILAAAALAVLAILYAVLAAGFARENDVTYYSEQEALGALLDGKAAMVDQITKGDKNVYVLYDPGTDGIFAVTVADQEGLFRLENQTPQIALAEGESTELTYPVDNMVLRMRVERDNLGKPAGYRIADTTVTA